MLRDYLKYPSNTSMESTTPQLLVMTSAHSPQEFTCCLLHPQTFNPEFLQLFVRDLRAVDLLEVSSCSRQGFLK